MGGDFAGQAAMKLMRAGAEMLNESIVMNDTYGVDADMLSLRGISIFKLPQADNDMSVYVDRRVWSKKSHAWVAWLAWCALAIFMVIVNRHIYGYMWRWFFWIHAVCGTLVFVLNFGTSYWAWHSFGYVFLFRYPHSYVAFILMWTLIIIVLHGIWTKKR
jgi:hypothetical protein